MKIKSFFLITLFSLLLFLAISPLRMGYFGGFPTSSLVGYITYFFLTIWCLNKFKGKLDIKYILLSIIIGHWILELPVRTLYFNATIISLPDSIIHTLGILCGFCYWYLKDSYKIITFLIGSLIAVLMYFQGWAYWVHFLKSTSII